MWPKQSRLTSTGGGTVLADARFGIIDELDRGYQVNPGLGMAKLFGARRHDMVAAYTPWGHQSHDTWNLNERCEPTEPPHGSRVS